MKIFVYERVRETGSCVQAVLNDILQEWCPTVNVCIPLNNMS